MFLPRLSAIGRPSANRATLCLGTARANTPKNSTSRKLQQQRPQSTSTSPTRFPQCLNRPRQEIPRNKRPRQRRHQSGTARAAAKALFKEYPYSVTAAAFFILCGAGSLMYANYIYHSYIIGAFHKFPEPVAKEMRKALYYTNISLEPKLAVKYYREAIRVADEIGMDPFSDEIIGVKIQLAHLMEKVQLYQKSIDILEIVKADNLKWVEKLGGIPGNEGQRTRVLGKTIGVSVKLGDLYANEHVLQKDKAEESLVWAVETVLKEQQRREKNGVKPEEGEWLTPEENGGAFEALAHHYEEKNQHYLAAPLFLQALATSDPSSCHTAILMNNLSISLAQQNPPPTPGLPSVSRSTLVSNARAWAEKAVAVAAKIKPPARTDECDQACAVATHNLGEFAEMDGDIAEARKRFEEARSLSQGLGFREGVVNAEEALRRIKKS